MGKSAGLWWRAVRPFSFTASVIPLILGAVIAYARYPDIDFRWFLFFLTVIAGVLVHAGTNLVNDYFDFKKRVDRKGTFGSSGLLVDGTMTPEEILKGAAVIFAVATLLGLIIVLSVERSGVVFVLALIGLLSGIFYTAAPVNLKYKAIGDLQVFLSMGILMTYGSYFVQTEDHSLRVIMFALPIGFLVDAILHGNNIRDIDSDSKVDIRTMAILLGDTRSREFYKWLVYGAYIAVTVCVIFFRLTLFSLLVFITFPLARKLVKLVESAKTSDTPDFAMIDMKTAQLHAAFGGLYIVGFFLHGLIF